MALIWHIILPVQKGEQEPKWREKSVIAAVTHVPSSAGLYAIGHDETVSGLVIRRVYVYVGMSSNLRRRLREHLPRRESKRALREYMLNNLHRAKCWYTTTFERTTLPQRERQLIDKLYPEFND